MLGAGGKVEKVNINEESQVGVGGKVVEELGKAV